MKKKYIKTLTLGMALTCAVPAMAQNRVIQGTVVDEHGEPVIGATVKIPGTKTAVVTDLEGNYTISVPGSSKSVVVSYIGYQDMTTTGGKLQLKENASDLNEVVVVGYGSQKKAHLTGSVATVDMNDVADLSAGGLASTLSGLVNGMSVSGGDARPGESATIYIRDTNSLSDIGSTAQQPLFVIDGYIYPNDVKVGNSSQNLGAEAFNNLDPSEIESISVLKDASAAVYGARAANGVILVTTKKGKMGAPRISYSGTFGITDAVSTPKMLDAYQYGRLYNAVKGADPTNTSLNRTTDLFQADELAAMKNTNYDLLDKYWSSGFTQQHSANISGATDRVSYFGGISYFDQDGNLGKLDYNRWNFRAGVDAKISKWLSASLNVSGDYGKKNKSLVKVVSSNDENDYRALLMRPRYIPESVNGYDIYSYGVSNSSANSIQNYAYDLLQNNGDYSKTMTSNLNINGSLNYDFGWSNVLKGLKLKFSYAKSINTSKNNEYGSSYTLYKMQNRFGSGSHLYTPVGDEDVTSYYDDSNFVSSTIANGNFLSRNMVRTDNYQMNFTVNYDRDFGKHHIGALFSIEKSEAESEYLYGYVSEPYSFTTGQSNSAEGTTNYTTFTRSESGTLSYIGRINYAYSNKYLLEFLLRSDASTKFAPQNYWGTFPSVSAGWVISEEDWMQKAAPWVNFLKVRASFGLTGRDNASPWQWQQIYAQDASGGVVFGTSASTSSGKRITINKNNSAVNTDIHWDKVYKMNLGIDFKTLDNRLGVTFDHYREWNREMLMNIAQTIPGTVGTQSASTNLGELNSWGYEIGLDWNDKIGKNFKYKIGINTGYSDNEVLNMDFEEEYIYRQITRGSRTDVGVWGMQCLGMFRSFQEINEYFEKYNITSYMGLSKDQVRPGMLIYKDVRGTNGLGEPDGIVNKDDDQVCLSTRSSNPYGFTTNLSASYKSFSLSAQLKASWGSYGLLPSMALSPYYSSIDASNMPSFWNVDNMYVYQDITDGSGNVVVAANRDAYYPSLAYTNINAVASSFWRISNTRVTLSRITLAYTVPKAWLSGLGIGIQSARFNVTAQNLLSFYNPYPDNFIDPMCSYGSYPTLRKFTIGVNLSF
ncbi:SusC/RagA family TonB-linked outer membrane protein [Segatella bryantii]|uniref:SusC/RagA family TonB-linked outer membrane protein n=1 Tax=Segatella bryantii TaxID=77095 RepID=UPI00242BECC9|nr:TonB-dependent receptor [Segatella bryantii]